MRQHRKYLNEKYEHNKKMSSIENEQASEENREDSQYLRDYQNQFQESFLLVADDIVAPSIGVKTV